MLGLTWALASQLRTETCIIALASHCIQYKHADLVDDVINRDYVACSSQKKPQATAGYLGLGITWWSSQEKIASLFHDQSTESRAMLRLFG